MKILFINMSALRFTVATPDHAPLGGSESSLCYLARALVRRGHEVALAANLPEGQDGNVHSVRHFALPIIKDATFFATEKFDAIILCNAPMAAAPLKMLSPNSRIIFWAHILPDQPSMQILAQARNKNAIDATVFVSTWQRYEIEKEFGVFNGAAIIGNGIAPAFENMFTSANDISAAKENRAVYTSTPFRGLSVLLRAMRGFDCPTKLDLFSSMKLYQAEEGEYADLLQQAAENDAIASHGAVTQIDLAAYLRRCSFLFYPCIFPETFCITAAEALAAGMKIVTTKLGALPETTQGFADLVPLRSYDGDVLADDFRAAMRRAVDKFTVDSAAWAQERFRQSRAANMLYNWDARALVWEEFLSAR